MNTVQITAVSYSYETAAAATGFSEDVIKRAVRAGDLQARYVNVDGRTIRKPVIEHDELRRWVREGAGEWSA